MQMRWTSPAWLCSKVQRGRVLRPTDGTGVRVWMRGARVVQVLQSRRALPPRPHLPAPAVGRLAQHPAQQPQESGGESRSSLAGTAASEPGSAGDTRGGPCRGKRVLPPQVLGRRPQSRPCPLPVTSPQEEAVLRPCCVRAEDTAAQGGTRGGDVSPESPRPSGSAGVDVAPLRGATAEPRGRSFRLRVFT